MKRSRKAIVKVDVSDEAPLEASKVVRQYTRKKKVATLTEQCLPNPAAAGTNHVKVKEEYDPDIEVLNFHSAIDNHVKIKQEDVTDQVNFDLNCTVDKANDQETIKEDDQIQRTRNNLPRRAKCSSSSESIGKVKDENKSNVSIKYQKIKEENVSDSNVTRRELLHTEIDIDIKMEPQDDEYHEENNIDGAIVETGVLQPEKVLKTKPKYTKTQHLAKPTSRKTVEMNVNDINGSIDLPNTRIIYLRSAAQLAQEMNIKQETDDDSVMAKVLKWRITNDSASLARNTTDKPNTNIANVRILDSTSLANNNENPSSNTKETPVVAQPKRRRIAFAHTMDQPNSIIGNVKIQDSISLANNNENPSNNTKGVPAVTQLTLKRIAFAPRPLRTYGKKQPDPVPFKKCFHVAVNNPSSAAQLAQEMNIKQETDDDSVMAKVLKWRITNDSASLARNTTDKPNTNIANVRILDSTSLANNNENPSSNTKETPVVAQPKRRRIAFAHTMVQPNSIIGNVKIQDSISLANNNENPSNNTKGVPAVTQLTLKRIAFAPRPLRTYGKKQPDPVPFKKCFLVAVNNPSTDGRKLWKDKLVDLKAKEPLFACDMCDRRFYTKAAVSQHIRKTHLVAARRHACDEPACGARFAFYFQLLAHRRAHTGAPLACDLCPLIFKSRSQYGLHLNTHLRERLFPCPVCMRRYVVYEHLLTHAAKHAPADTFSCASCDATFRTVVDLARHAERDHGKKTEFPCYYCGRTLDSNAEMLAHIKTRHDNLMHYCAFCPRRFDDVERFERHSAEHVQQITPIEAFSKRHVCGICNKKFNYASVLKTHMATHTGARPFECDECGQRLKTRSALTEHVTAHSRPYACPQCARRFGKRDSLARHLLLHSGEKPHQCTDCDQKFSQRSSMMLHKKRFHSVGLKKLPKKKPKKNGKRAKDFS